MNEVFEKILERMDEASVLRVNSKEYFNNPQNGEYVDDVVLMKDAIKIVNDVAEEYNGGWIACSERLPEPIRPVLVTLKNWMNDKCFVRVGRFHTDHWKTDEGIVENSVVIAWQPLPEPFKERD